MSRATPMTPDQRRQALVSATVHLLLTQGAELSTREIATAAGVAEGTIFRAFETKSELIHAAVHAALEPTQAVADIEALPEDQTMPQRVTALLNILITEGQRTRALMSHLATSLGKSRHIPVHPGHGQQPGRTPHDARRKLTDATASALKPYHFELRVDTLTTARLLIALTFAMTFDLTGTQQPSAESISDLVLHGVSEGIR